MSAVDTIKELREKTGAGIMDCKTALAQSQGDLSKAIDYLRQKGLATAAKKAGRETREGIIGSYIHFGGKIGVLVEVNCETDFVARNPEFQELVRDIAMQVAGSTPPPQYIRREEVPAEIAEKERNIFIAQARETKKPEAVIAKIAEGKLEKFFEEICLLEQSFIKDPQIKIKDLIAQKIAKIGENIHVRRFTRYQLGEGEA
ncbi:MAG: translation elongation factor Ts [Candidatus Manganitrophaceae bacterium]|nr:MAG: translation elongation factor Ts [Candidatus Manganitrophaceae bacterium]